MKKSYSVILVFGITLLFLIQLTGCAFRNKTLTGADKDAVLAYSEAKTDNLLAGMNANDYAMFSKDFDKEMLAAMPQPQFDSLKKDRDARLGVYVSRKVNSVVQIGDFYSVTYDTKFEKDDAVSMRVVFRAAEPHQISGLWFNK
jgi:hypothetical protein